MQEPLSYLERGDLVVDDILRGFVGSHSLWHRVGA